MIIVPLSIRFYLRTSRTTARKGIPIWVRIVLRRKKIELYTYHNVLEEKYWDGVRGRVNQLPGSNANYLNRQLSNIEARVYDLKDSIEKLGKEVSVDTMRLALKESSGSSYGILQYLDDYIKKLKVLSAEYANGTVKQYITTRAHLAAYLKSIGRRDLPLSDFSRAHLAALEDFLMTEYINKQYGRSLSRNSCNKYLVRLKTALKAAVRKSLIAQSPFDQGFKLKYTKTQRKALTKEEVDRLIKYDFSHSATLQRIKDVFCFAIFSGLRFSDIMALRATDVSKIKDRYFLCIRQIKTKEELTIPLLRNAENILLKYSEYQLATGYTLPHLTNQKINLYLKIIGDAINVQGLTFHVARHTFATTILLSNQIDLKATSAWLGHTSLRSSEIYSKVNIGLLSDLADMVDKKLDC
ncbi:MAG TPA: site-specific integrase [Bacteroidia bacterium]|jgi:integrase|nr:site-specific integrase [Bacteroidia bacterium]